MNRVIQTIDVRQILSFLFPEYSHTRMSKEVKTEVIHRSKIRRFSLFNEHLSFTAAEPLIV
jgi:hypothetical protein